MGNKVNLIKPIILYEGEYKLDDISRLKKHSKIWKTVDLYRIQLKELFEITYPNLINSKDFHKAQEEFIEKKTRNNPQIKGNWIYFPWNGNLVHMLNEDEYFELRTNRNKLLITDREQIILKNSIVAFVGLSIGANMAVSLAYSGISKTMKLAEYDILATSNLNRVRASIHEVGLSKIQVTANKIYEIDPYADLIFYNKGLDSKNINSFLTTEPKPQLIFEACDDFLMKVKIRLEAKEKGIPVVMLTSLGDSLLVDIERYDINKSLQLFNGQVGNITEEILSGEITEKNKKKYAIMLVGPQNVPDRAMQTINLIGKTLVGRPQINSTVTVGAGIASYLAKEILLKNSTYSGRRKIVFSDVIN